MRGSIRALLDKTADYLFGPVCPGAGGGGDHTTPPQVTARAIGAHQGSPQDLVELPASSPAA